METVILMRRYTGYQKEPKGKKYRQASGGLESEIENDLESKLFFLSLSVKLNVISSFAFKICFLLSVSEIELSLSLSFLCTWWKIVTAG